MADTRRSTTRYQRPDWVTRRIVNPIFSYVVRRLGRSIAGASLLAVPGRRTGRRRETIVNVLQFDGERYLVAPRGDTEWARNLRKAGRGTLRIGAREELIHVTEIEDDAKPPILRAYLDRWQRTVGQFFDVAGPDASDAEFRRIAPNHPVFRINHR